METTSHCNKAIALVLDRNNGTPPTLLLLALEFSSFVAPKLAFTLGDDLSLEVRTSNEVW